ncbi:MAG: hypothetical protein ACM3WV_03835 [Bacillota bacterium]
MKKTSCILSVLLIFYFCGQPAQAAFNITACAVSLSWYNPATETPSGLTWNFTSRTAFYPGWSCALNLTRSWERDFSAHTGYRADLDFYYRKGDWQAEAGWKTAAGDESFHGCHLGGKYFWQGGAWQRFSWTHLRTADPANPHSWDEYRAGLIIMHKPFYITLEADKEYNYYEIPGAYDYQAFSAGATLKYKTPSSIMTLYMEASDKNYYESADGYEKMLWSIGWRFNILKMVIWELEGTILRHQGDSQENARICWIDGTFLVKRFYGFEINGQATYRWGSSGWSEICPWYKAYFYGNIEIKGKSGGWSFAAAPFWRRDSGGITEGVLWQAGLKHKGFSLKLNYSPEGNYYETSRKGIWGNVSWNL